MKCQDAQDLILDFETPIELAHHLSECEGCRGFANAQAALDRQLSEAIPARALSPSFRETLMEKVQREPRQIWSENLPDAAHLAGGILATAVCVCIFPAGFVVLAGLALTVATYFVQSVIRDAVGTWQESGQ